MSGQFQVKILLFSKNVSIGEDDVSEFSVEKESRIYGTS
jgi:hypothetical protein